MDRSLPITVVGRLPEARERPRREPAAPEPTVSADVRIEDRGQGINPFVRLSFRPVSPVDRPVRHRLNLLRRR